MKRMLSLLALAAMIALPVAAQDESSERDTESGSDLKDVLGKAAEYESYKFSSTTKTEGMPNRGGRGGGGEGRERGATTGEYQKDVGMLVKLGGRFEVVKIDDGVAYQGQDGWTKLERPERGQGGGGQNGDRRQRQLQRMLRGLKEPHLEIEALADGIEEEKASDEKGVFEVALTEDAAGKLSGFGRMLRRMEDAEISGTATITVEDGKVVKYEIKTEVKATFREQELEITATKTVELSDIGDTEVEIPEEAKDALDE